MSYENGVYVHRGAVAVPPAERFWLRVDKTETCWNWTGATNGVGYGRLGGDPGKFILAHRFSYEMNVGPIPEGLFLDHLCHNRACVRPDHLEPVTNQENLIRGIAYRHRDRGNFCKHGHELTPENIYRRPGKPTWTGCKTCKAEAGKRSRERLAAPR